MLIGSKATGFWHPWDIQCPPLQHWLISQLIPIIWWSVPLTPPIYPLETVYLLLYFLIGLLDINIACSRHLEATYSIFFFSDSCIPSSSGPCHWRTTCWSRSLSDITTCPKPQMLLSQAWLWSECITHLSRFWVKTCPIVRHFLNWNYWLDKKEREGGKRAMHVD